MHQSSALPISHTHAALTLPASDSRLLTVTLQPVRDVCVLMLHSLLLRVAEGLDDTV